MFLFGGWNGVVGLAAPFALDTTTFSWRALRSVGHSAPSARNNHAAAVTPCGLMVLHGGHNGQRWLGDLHVADVASAVGGELPWLPCAPAGEGPSPRACHSLTVVGSAAVVFGGFDGARTFNDVHVLEGLGRESSSVRWVAPALTGAPPAPRNAHAAAALPGRPALVVFGGHSGRAHLRDVHVLDLAARRWSQPALCGAVQPPGLRGHSACMAGDALVVFGGFDGRARTNDAWLLNTAAGGGGGGAWAWSRLLPQAAGAQGEGAPPSVRQRHSACLVPGIGVLVYGGFDGAAWLGDAALLSVEARPTDTPALLAGLGWLVNNADAFCDVELLVSEGEGAGGWSEGFGGAGAGGGSGDCGGGGRPAGGEDGGGGSGGGPGSPGLAALSSGGSDPEPSPLLLSSTPPQQQLRRRREGDGGSGGGGGGGCSSGASAGASPGNVLFAHRAILAARVPYFRALFMNGLRESHAPPSTLRLSFVEYGRGAVLALLEWVYTGRVFGEHLTQPAAALDALQLADQLGAEPFKALAEAALCDALSEHTAAALLAAASRAGAATLKAAALRFIVDGGASDLGCLTQDPPLLLEVTLALAKRAKGGAPT
jgi:hypothetical protein